MKPKQRLKHISIGLMLVMLSLAVGCDQPPQVSSINMVKVWIPQGPVRVTGQADPVGAQTLVFLCAGPDGSQTVLGHGTLEMMVFDGNLAQLTPAQLTLAKPLKTWTFTPQDLLKARAKTYGLWSYQLPLVWGENAPMKNGITILAKYIETNGQEIYSETAYMPF